MSLKSREALVELYAGLDAHKETIVYCHSGVRASQTAIVLMDLGFRNVRVYDSSWMAYGNTFEAPVDNATYFNVARVNSMINLLQSRIDELETELEQLKSTRATRQ
jgi:thiosulfate/3-mercaptopyruvate sulfurtransferase